MASPKFKVTIVGVKTGYHPDRVKNDLMHTLSANEKQVDELLNNRAPVSSKLLAHTEAFKVKSGLQELGVDCQISPVPLFGLAERVGTLTMSGPNAAKDESARRPQVVRRAHHAAAMRSGKAAAPTPRKKVRPKVGAMQVVALIGAILLTSWLANVNPIGLFQTTPSVASMADLSE